MVLGREAQVELFLDVVRELARQKRVRLVRRDETMAFLNSHNILLDDVVDVLLGLQTSDRFDGPEPDRDERYRDRWTVAEFAPLTDYGRLYLKLSIVNTHTLGKVLSLKLYREKECP